MDSRHLTTLPGDLSSALPAIRAPVSMDEEDNDIETSGDDEGSQYSDVSARFWIGDEGFESASEPPFLPDTDTESEGFHDTVEGDGGALLNDAGSSFSGMFWPSMMVPPIAKVSDEADDANFVSGSDVDEPDGEFHGLVGVSVSTEEEDVSVVEDTNLVEKPVEAMLNGLEEDGNVLVFNGGGEILGFGRCPVRETNISTDIGSTKEDSDQDDSKFMINLLVDATKLGGLDSPEDDTIETIDVEAIEDSKIAAEGEDRKVLGFNGSEDILGFARYPVPETNISADIGIMKEDSDEEDSQFRINLLVDATNLSELDSPGDVTIETIDLEAVEDDNIVDEREDIVFDGCKTMSQVAGEHSVDVNHSVEREELVSVVEQVFDLKNEVLDFASPNDLDEPGHEFQSLVGVPVSTEEDVGIVEDGYLVEKPVESTLKGLEEDGKVLGFNGGEEILGFGRYPVHETNISRDIDIMKEEHNEENSVCRMNLLVEATKLGELDSPADGTIETIDLEVVKDTNIAAEREDVVFGERKTMSQVAGEHGVDVNHSVEREELVSVVEQVFDLKNEVLDFASRNDLDGPDHEFQSSVGVPVSTEEDVGVVADRYLVEKPVESTLKGLEEDEKVLGFNGGEEILGFGRYPVHETNISRDIGIMKEENIEENSKSRINLLVDATKLGELDSLADGTIETIDLEVVEDTNIVAEREDIVFDERKTMSQVAGKHGVDVNHSLEREELVSVVEQTFGLKNEFLDFTSRNDLDEPDHEFQSLVGVPVSTEGDYVGLVEDENLVKKPVESTLNGLEEDGKVLCFNGGEEILGFGRYPVQETNMSIEIGIMKGENNEENSESRINLLVDTRKLGEHDSPADDTIETIDLEAEEDSNIVTEGEDVVFDECKTRSAVAEEHGVYVNNFVEGEESVTVVDQVHDLKNETLCFASGNDGFQPDPEFQGLVGVPVSTKEDVVSVVEDGNLVEKPVESTLKGLEEDRKILCFNGGEEILGFGRYPVQETNISIEIGIMKEENNEENSESRIDLPIDATKSGELDSPADCTIETIDLEVVEDRNIVAEREDVIFDECKIRSRVAGEHGVDLNHSVEGDESESVVDQVFDLKNEVLVLASGSDVDESDHEFHGLVGVHVSTEEEDMGLVEDGNLAEKLVESTLNGLEEDEKVLGFRYPVPETNISLEIDITKEESDEENSESCINFVVDSTKSGELDSPADGTIETIDLEAVEDNTIVAEREDIVFDECKTRPGVAEEHGVNVNHCVEGEESVTVVDQVHDLKNETLGFASGSDGDRPDGQFQGLVGVPVSTEEDYVDLVEDGNLVEKPVKSTLKGLEEDRKILCFNGGEEILGFGRYPVQETNMSIEIGIMKEENNEENSESRINLLVDARKLGELDSPVDGNIETIDLEAEEDSNIVAEGEDVVLDECKTRSAVAEEHGVYVNNFVEGEESVTVVDQVHDLKNETLCFASGNDGFQPDPEFQGLVGVPVSTKEDVVSVVEDGNLVEKPVESTLKGLEEDRKILCFNGGEEILGFGRYPVQETNISIEIGIMKEENNEENSESRIDLPIDATQLGEFDSPADGTIETIDLEVVEDSNIAVEREDVIFDECKARSRVAGEHDVDVNHSVEGEETESVFDRVYDLKNEVHDFASGSDVDEPDREFHGLGGVPVSTAEEDVGGVPVSTEEEDVGLVEDGNLVEKLVERFEEDEKLLCFNGVEEILGFGRYPDPETNISLEIDITKEENDEESSESSINLLIDATKLGEFDSPVDGTIETINLETVQDSNIVTERDDIVLHECKTRSGVAGKHGVDVNHSVEGEEYVSVGDQVLDLKDEIFAEELDANPKGHTREMLKENLETGSQVFDGSMQELHAAKELEKLMMYNGRASGDSPAKSNSDVDHDEDDKKHPFDYAALSALLKAALSASPENATYEENDSSLVSSEAPAGLGSSLPSLQPSAGAKIRLDDSSITEIPVSDNTSEQEKNRHEKINNLRVTFLRLLHKLGHSPKEPIPTQVLYRLSLAERLPHPRITSRSFSIDAAEGIARKLEEDGNTDLDFSCTILIIGKTGAGKSATINSVFGEKITQTNAFQPCTNLVREFTGVVKGAKLRLIDTPGLRTSVMEQSANRNILSSVKRFMKKFPPDVILYVDRIDAVDREFNHLPLLQSIASILGPSTLSNAIVALTHSACTPPDGSVGAGIIGYETFIQHHVNSLQNIIRRASGDMHLVNQMVLVENHSSCRQNQDGHQVLPNGQSWLPHLLMLCYSRKMLMEANSLLNLPDSEPLKFFLGGMPQYQRSPLPFLLSTLLQSRSSPRAAAAVEEDGILDSEDELSDSDEYDELPPFKPLQNSQISKLSKEQRKAYFDEYEYRVKLLRMKQLKEERRYRREQKKQSGAMAGLEASEHEDGGGGGDIQEPMPDIALPLTFDPDSSAFRYKHIGRTRLHSGPVLNNQVWDHDSGYDGITLEKNLVVAGRFPAGFSGQIIKDKNEFNIHMDSSISMKHGDHGSTLAAFDVQTMGMQLVYILSGETKFKNFKKNKTAARLLLAQTGKTLASGIKLEDQILLGKSAILGAAIGAMGAGSNNVAYGLNVETSTLDQYHPISQDATKLGFSLMRWRRGDMALGANLQTRFSVGHGTKTVLQIGLNNKMSGQIKVRTCSSDQLQIALVGLLPVVGAIFRFLRPGELQH